MTWRAPQRAGLTDAVLLANRARACGTLAGFAHGDRMIFWILFLVGAFVIGGTELGRIGRQYRWLSYRRERHCGLVVLQLSHRVMNASVGLSTDTRFPTRRWWTIGYSVIVGGGLLVAAIARRRVAEPFLGLSLVIILLLVLGWILHPRATLYATLCLTTISEFVTICVAPFARNFSSPHSISYLSDALTISPLEVTLFSGVLISCLRHYASTGQLMPRNPLTRPLMFFMLLVAFGFVKGVGNGGVMRDRPVRGARAPLHHARVHTCRERVHRADTSSRCPVVGAARRGRAVGTDGGALLALDSQPTCGC